METWAWLLAYVVGFGLLQVALYHHFRRNDATAGSGGASERVSASEHGGAQTADGRDDEAPDGPTVYCQHCGVRNEHFSTVRYCRECVSPLR